MIYVENNFTDPYFNFALEYYLINEKDLGDNTIFMFWRTNPTVMIGKFQNTIEEINTKFVQDNNINVVRRITGGGTIYTDMNGWQFSFINKNSSNYKIDFTTFIDPIINALKNQGINAYFNNRNDLLIDGKKFSGNAQYIKGNKKLHHGSILFDTNIENMVKSITVAEDKIISKGIKSVRERVANVKDYMTDDVDDIKFKEIMLSYLLKESKGTYKLTSEDIERVEEIADSKFRTWQWNYGNSPRFNITKGKRYEGGKIEFKINVEKGIITDSSIYGDFFGEGDVDEINEILIGCKYNNEDIENAFRDVDLNKYFYKINKKEIIDCII